MVDGKTKELLYEGEGQEKTYKYDKEGAKKRNKENRELVDEFNEKEVEVEPFITTDIPEELSEYQKELLTGLII